MCYFSFLCFSFLVKKKLLHCIITSDFFYLPLTKTQTDNKH